MVTKTHQDDASPRLLLVIGKVVMSDSDKGSTGCGCFILLLVLLGVIKSSGIPAAIDLWWSDHQQAVRQEEARKIQKEAADQRAKEEADAASQKARVEAELEADLQKFGKQLVPHLHQAIEKYQEQIRQYTAQRAVFATEMAKIGVNPEERPAYKRLGEIIEKMTTDVQGLLAARKETYIKWKELQLLRDTEDTKKQRDALLLAAHESAKSAEDTFNKYMKQSKDHEK